MTREEARKIVFEKMKCYEGKECQQFIDVVEALGLIKFDKEEDKAKWNAVDEALYLIKKYNMPMPTDTFITRLESNGYKIVEK